MVAKKRRGRPPGSRVDPVVRMFRQTGNADHMAAVMARAIIDWHKPPPREKIQALIAAYMADEKTRHRAWPLIDYLACLDFAERAGFREERRITHKEAVGMAIKELGDGVSKPKVTIYTDHSGHRVVRSEKAPGAPLIKPRSLSEY